MRNRLVLLALLLPVIGACSSDASSSDASSSAASAPVATTATTLPAAADVTTTVVAAPTPTEAATDATTGAVAAAGAVGIADFKFDPATINVAVGGSIVWTNNDPQQHTATSAGNFDAGAIQPGASATVEFPTAGTFAYICSFHPFMNGTVVVG